MIRCFRAPPAALRFKSTLAVRALNALPPSLQGYGRLIRMDRPIGSWLLFWPCAWSTSMAAAHGLVAIPTTLGYIGLFGIGSVIMRGAGCTINDMWDRDLDKRVSRTRDRPLANGQLSYTQAWVFLAAQMTAGLAVLVQFNQQTILMGAGSLALVAAYPLFKRFTYFPQAMLGITFSWGALMGFPALVPMDIPWGSALSLYSSCVIWTVMYDTIYAHQDKVDDAQVGIKSTALKFGDDTKTFLTWLLIPQTALLGLAGYLNDSSFLYFGGVAASTLHIAWQIYKVDLDNPDDCLLWFKRSSHTGAIIFSGTYLDYMYRLLF